MHADTNKQAECQSDRAPYGERQIRRGPEQPRIGRLRTGPGAETASKGVEAMSTCVEAKAERHRLSTASERSRFDTRAKRQDQGGWGREL